MDLSHYIKKSNSLKVLGFREKENEKTCMQCGKALSRELGPLYYQRFCSMKCKEDYCGRSFQD